MHSCFAVRIYGQTFVCSYRSKDGVHFRTAREERNDGALWGLRLCIGQHAAKDVHTVGHWLRPMFGQSWKPFCCLWRQVGLSWLGVFGSLIFVGLGPSDLIAKVINCSLRWLWWSHCRAREASDGWPCLEELCAHKTLGPILFLACATLDHTF